MVGSFLPGLGWFAPPKSTRAWEPTLLWNQFHVLTAGHCVIWGCFTSYLFIMPHNPNRPRELIRMKLRLLLAVWLVYGSLAAAQDVPNPHVRFFNDSAKAVNFFVDGQFGCSVPANPEGNNAYCDAEIGTGKHTLSVKVQR